MDDNREIEGYEIIVIQSLKQGDLKTGDLLYKDVLKGKKNVTTKCYNVSTKKELEELLVNIEKLIPSNHILTLHFETHGCNEGIGIYPSVELMSWKELFELIRPINIKTSNLLMVVLSMCCGAAISSLVDPYKRCPYRAFIGFEHSVSEGVLKNAFRSFYEAYDNLLDIDKALEQMKRILPNDVKPWCYTAERIFDMALNPDTNPESFATVIDQSYSGFNKQGEPVSKVQFAEEVRQYFIRTAKENRDYYNFKDLQS